MFGVGLDLFFFLNHRGGGGGVVFEITFTGNRGYLHVVVGVIL